jgi:hypothetical protein
VEVAALPPTLVVLTFTITDAFDASDMGPQVRF